MDYAGRRRRIKERFEGFDGLLLGKKENRRYLSGFTGSEGFLYLSGKHEVLFVDFRYTIQAREETTLEILEVKKFFEEMADFIKGEGIKRLGFEADWFTYAMYEELSKFLTDIELVPVKGLVEKMRAVKDEEEISKIRQAAHIADRVFSQIIPYIREGVRERELALEIEYRLKREGAEACAFPIIVASGVRGALPHGNASDKVIKRGEGVIIDFGAVVEGYHSDLTRTVFVGRMSEEMRRIYNAVRAAGEQALNGMYCGMKASKADELAREYLGEAGLDKFFGHGLGHGVGLEVHEAPKLGPRSEDELEAGMVFTVEPGVYLEGVGGVRIEEMVLMREEGVEVLTRASKEIIEI